MALMHRKGAHVLDALQCNHCLQAELCGTVGSQLDGVAWRQLVIPQVKLSCVAKSMHLAQGSQSLVNNAIDHLLWVSFCLFASLVR